MSRMVTDRSEREKIDLQLDIFKHTKGLLGIDNAIMTRIKKSPADWWDSFGDECPELQRFSIRILSLTCSSSGCERNWSVIALVLGELFVHLCVSVLSKSESVYVLLPYSVEQFRVLLSQGRKGRRS